MIKHERTIEAAVLDRYDRGVFACVRETEMRVGSRAARETSTGTVVTHTSINRSTPLSLFPVSQSPMQSRLFSHRLGCDTCLRFRFHVAHDNMRCARENALHASA